MIIHQNAGDAVDGLRIAIECRGYSKWRVGHRTGAHRGSQATLENGFCIIEQEYEFVAKRRKNAPTGQVKPPQNGKSLQSD